MNNIFLLNEMINYIEHTRTDDVICPSCGEKQPLNFIFKPTTTHLDLECQDCQEYFRLWEEIDETYSTEKL
jgi:uncharacterized Zn finger protein